MAPVEFPLPPAGARPWIYANMIASRNGIVGWTPRGPEDNAVRSIAGADRSRPGRQQDREFMGYLRACADAVGVGAQTLRDEPSLRLTPDALPGPGRTVVADWRQAQGRRPCPLQVLYSASGHVDLAAPMFNTEELTAIVVTSAAGARRLREQGSEKRRVTLLVVGDDISPAEGLVRAHQQLARDHGVRYLECEGGERILQSLHAANILDEVFVTVTDVDLDPEDRTGVRHIFAFEKESAMLVEEHRARDDAGYLFQRWRFTQPPTAQPPGGSRAHEYQ